jgi:hypothetical protein
MKWKYVRVRGKGRGEVSLKLRNTKEINHPEVYNII